jgi:hypothetical protein
MIRTLNLHLLLVSTDHADFFRNYAELKGVGLEELCHQISKNNHDWVDRVFGDEGWRIADLKHDFVGLLKQDEHFLPRI